MSWLFLALLSAIALGIYELLKKLAVRDNAVLPVLFSGVLTGASAWLILRGVTAHLPSSWHAGLTVDPLTGREHLAILAKGYLVAASWVFGYVGLKHLPITVAGPIRSTAPLWTILLAVTFLGEWPEPAQWIGVLLILVAFTLFSRFGKAEGIVFHKNRWIYCIVAATALGAISSLYDKVLLHSMGIRVATLQFWFSIYLVVAMILPMVWWWKQGHEGTFQWRWTIPAVGLGLLIADALYFAAIAQEGALISVISPVRRTSVIIGFAAGAIFLGERKALGRKIFALALMLGGVAWLQWAGR
jgi:bacterial/archaeal transporter family protein